MLADCAKKEKANANSRRQCGFTVSADRLCAWIVAGLDVRQRTAKLAKSAEIQRALSVPDARGPLQLYIRSSSWIVKKTWPHICASDAVASLVLVARLWPKRHKKEEGAQELWRSRCMCVWIVKAKSSGRKTRK